MLDYYFWWFRLLVHLIVAIYSLIADKYRCILGSQYSDAWELPTTNTTISTINTNETTTSTTNANATTAE